ncbi:MAG: NAD-dependent epimerase/dehydratase family protein [Eubacteriales bacterium]|nr:NAD-dependent epimerase/dehydratase family protein [Eubacteriales bacterium]
MAKAKILVTGANGYIGRHVVKQLLDHDHFIVFAVDLANTGIDPRATYLNVDIFADDVDLYSRLGSPDVCIHLAWRDGFNHKSEYHIQSIPQHFSFIKRMIEGGLQQLAVMGSMHEIGYHEGAISEGTACNPSSYYGIAKNTLRQIAVIYAAEKKISFQWLRGYYIYGDDLKNHSVFTKIAEMASRGETEFPFTSGLNRYDFQSIESLANQIASAVEQTEITGVIECCSGVGIPLKDKVEEYIRDNGYAIKLKYGAFPDRVYDSPGVWGDATKINRIMGNK